MTPVFVHHGLEDLILMWKSVKITFQKMNNDSREFIVHTEPGLGHTIGQKGISLLKSHFYKFLGSVQKK